MLEEGAVVAGRWAQTVSGCPMRPPATRNRRNVLINFISENAAHEGPDGKLCYKYSGPSCRLGEQDSAAVHLSEGGSGNHSVYARRSQMKAHQFRCPR